MSTGQNILIIGGGAREHALGWKLEQSKHVKNIYYVPGNGGTKNNLDFNLSDLEKIFKFARDNECFTVVGSEEPLSRGIVDYFEKGGLQIFGPTKRAALLETSKAFSKSFMKDNNILTAKFAIFEDPDSAKKYVQEQQSQLVVKADGLASGKGVIVCDNKEQTNLAIDRILVDKEFGQAGNKIIIEERLYGQEASFIAICDGKNIKPLATSQDHKRAFDGDSGPNTGGMGSYSPASIIDKITEEKIITDIINPTVKAMGSRRTPFKGFLYAGILLEEQTKKLYVLEFNVRMGDPECQPLMMRFNSDLFEYLKASVEGKLETLPPIKWLDNYAVCVVMATRGYPGKFAKGMQISGLESENEAQRKSKVIVFHAGTTRNSSGSVVTSGGRVLSVTAMGESMKEAIDLAYNKASMISWGNSDQYYRKDIGLRYRKNQEKFR